MIAKIKVFYIYSVKVYFMSSNANIRFTGFYDS